MSEYSENIFALDFQLEDNTEKISKLETIKPSIKEFLLNEGQFSLFQKEVNNIEKNNLLNDQITRKDRKRRIFTIRKILKEKNNYIGSGSSYSEKEKDKTTCLKKKISPYSKVNFSKLTDEEKDERLSNLSRLAYRLKKKVRKLENNIKLNPCKVLNNLVRSKLGNKSKNNSFNFEKLIKAFKKIKKCNSLIDYEDQKYSIVNLINFIADEKLKPNSFEFKKICTQIRLLLDKDKTDYLNKSIGKTLISFPEKQVSLSQIEYSKYNQFKNNEEALRSLVGVYEPNEQIIKVKEVTVETKEINPENTKDVVMNVDLLNKFNLGLMAYNFKVFNNLMNNDKVSEKPTERKEQK